MHACIHSSHSAYGILLWQPEQRGIEWAGKRGRAVFLLKLPASVALGTLIDVLKNHIKHNKEVISTQRMGLGFRQT